MGKRRFARQMLQHGQIPPAPGPMPPRTDAPRHPAGPHLGKRADARGLVLVVLQCVNMRKPPQPVLGREVYIAPTAFVGGDVTLGDHVTVMHQVVIRGDVAPIRIGARVNIQDGSVVMGVPGRVVRQTNAQDLAAIDEVVQNYVAIGRSHAAGRFANIATL